MKSHSSTSEIFRGASRLHVKQLYRVKVVSEGN